MVGIVNLTFFLNCHKLQGIYWWILWYTICTCLIVAVVGRSHLTPVVTLCEKNLQNQHWGSGCSWIRFILTDPHPNHCKFEDQDAIEIRSTINVRVLTGISIRKTMQI